VVSVIGTNGCHVRVKLNVLGATFPPWLYAIGKTGSIEVPEGAVELSSGIF